MYQIERHIIQGCLEGNRAAQARLYDQYCRTMIVVCLRYSRNREEAEEIMQEGFYRVFRYISLFKHQGSFEGWIKKIMVKAALQKYRPKSDLPPVIPIDSPDQFTDLYCDIYADIHVKELLVMVQCLPTACRLVFNLFVFEGYKHREIAVLLGISEGTSKSNLFDARLMLQKKITSQLQLVSS